MPDTDQLLIRDFKKEDTERCINLWVQSMASGYEDRLLLENAASQADGQIGIIAETNSDVVGFGAAHLATFADALEIPFHLVEPQCPITADTQIGYVDIVTVAEEHRNRGIGTKLLAQLNDRLERFDVPIVTETWERDGVDGNAIAGKLGFETTVQRNDYWIYSSHGYDDCPECGSSPCQCSGTLFINSQGEYSES